MRLNAALVTGLFAASALAQDAQSGKDVYGPCAACHGKYGEGGKGGEYPRVAGQPAGFVVDQLVLFQTRKRHNLPMFPYTEPRELSAGDMKDVAAFLAGIKLPTRAPSFKDTDDALFRLEAMEKVLVVSRVEGDVQAGATTYKRRCASCHGRQGQGKKSFPALVGQYPDYLQRQLDEYLKGSRPHENEEAGKGVLTKLTPKDLTDVLAWLTSIQDQEVEAEKGD
jgi:cytochrome c553